MKLAPVALAFTFALAVSRAPLVERLSAGDWLQFRGSDSSGVSEEENLPLAWSVNEGGDGERGKDGKVAWRVDLPGRGVSSPIVAGDKVILTASSGVRQDRLHVLCFDARTGSKLWERQFWATGRTMCHPKTCMAAPTPASDGERVYAFYSTNDLFALDLEGNLAWLRGLTADYPNATSGIGMASSPIVAGDVVVIQVENQSHSFAAGIDRRTGENRWKIARSPNPSWSSPVLLRGDGSAERKADVLVLESWSLVSGHDPATGRELWVHDGPMNCIPSCAVAGGLLVVPAQGLTALRPSVLKGDSGRSSPEVAWRSERLRPGMASPLVYDRRVYVASGAGILACADAATGEVIWQLRLKGPFSSSPVAAGGRLYCVNEAGLVQVVKIPTRAGEGGAHQKTANEKENGQSESGEKGEVVGASDMGETILATPAIALGAVFLRSDAHLWKITR